MPPSRRPSRPVEPAPSLEDRAVSDLSIIRSTIARSGRFTAVPGWGGVFMALVGGSAALVAGLQSTPEAWLHTWLVAAVIALAGGGYSMHRKAMRQELPLFSGTGRRFLLGLCPPLLAGAALTALLWGAGLHEAMPAMWLLLFGAAVVTGGAYSVPVVPLTGGAFMALGLVAAVAPASWGTPLLGAGFGGLLLITGLWIAKRHGG